MGTTTVTSRYTVYRKHTFRCLKEHTFKVPNQRDIQGDPKKGDTIFRVLHSTYPKPRGNLGVEKVAKTLEICALLSTLNDARIAGPVAMQQPQKRAQQRVPNCENGGIEMGQKCAIFRYSLFVAECRWKQLKVRRSSFRRRRREEKGVNFCVCSSLPIKLRRRCGKTR